jgi:hypothetical protein
MLRCKAFLFAAALTAVVPAFARAQIVRPSIYWGYRFLPYATGPGNAIRSEGEFLVNLQYARLLNEDVKQKKLETERKELEHMSWVRDFELEEWKKVRLRQQEYNEARAYSADIKTGQIVWALNEFLKRMSYNEHLSSSQPITIPAGLLKNIDITVTGRSIGILRQDRVEWPLILMREGCKDRRDSIEKLRGEARETAAKGDMPVEPIRELTKIVLEWRGELLTEYKQNQIDVQDFSDANTVLKSVERAARQLERPREVAFQLKGLPDCKDVIELVLWMKGQAARFADMREGYEQDYLRLHALMKQQAMGVLGTK